ncbi:MAG: hypothetical protein IJ911_11335 [Salinivirgaceae bacterium]|nr:hypothetical protein [Salinivirgaceae bacterium]
MKRTLILFFALMGSLLANSQQLNVNFDYAVYMLSDKRSYVETYLLIDGKSVNYTVNDVNLESKIDVTMIFKNADDLVEFRHFIVGNPPLPDTTEIFPDFTDVQRIFIPQGIYNFELKIKDLNASKENQKTITRHEIIAIDIPQKQVALSGIELLESFTPKLERTINLKNGYECIPYCRDTISQDVDFLRFYVELYNVAAELDGLGSCNVYTSIRNAHSLRTMTGHSSSTSVNALNYYQFLKEINIKKLPAGNYFLTVEIQDKYNKTVGTATKYFERKSTTAVLNGYAQTNKTLRNAAMYTSVDTLTNILNAMKMLADNTEIETLDKAIAASDMILMQQTLHDFWAQRNQFAPESALSDFVNRFNAANSQNYSPDQTLLMLRYGFPNTIVDRTDAAKPFVVWHYYKIGNLTNIKFVFTPQNGNLTLLHSNMPCERQDEGWKTALFANGEPTQNEAEIFEGL